MTETPGLNGEPGFHSDFIFCRIPGIREISEIRGEKVRFLDACQEYILDKKAPGTRFDQCLQGFRVIKEAPTMGCTISALCAKILQ